MAQYGNSMQRTTPIVLNLIIINALVFIAEYILAPNTEVNRITDLFALHYYKSEYFKPYQLVTHMFMHGGVFHILFNMYALWMFGSVLERVWGPKRFLIFYLVCGLAAAAAQMASYSYNFGPVAQMNLSSEAYDQYQEILRKSYTVGASGAIMGLLAGFAYLFPNTQFYILPFPFPIKAKYLVPIYAAIDLFGGLHPGNVDNVAHFAHLGGMVMGFILVLIWNKTNKQTFY